MADDIDFILESVNRSIIKISNYEFGSKEWLRSTQTELNSQPTAIKWRLIEKLFYPVFKFNLGKRQALKLLETVMQESVACQLPGQITVKLKQGGIEIQETKQESQNAV